MVGEMMWRLDDEGSWELKERILTSRLRVMRSVTATASNSRGRAFITIHY